jgi:hypothetical protein
VVIPLSCCNPISWSLRHGMILLEIGLFLWSSFHAHALIGILAESEGVIAFQFSLPRNVLSAFLEQLELLLYGSIRQVLTIRGLIRYLGKC